MKKLISAIFLSALATHTIAETWGPESGHYVTDVSVYWDGGVVMQINPPLNVSCSYNYATHTPTTSPAYKMISTIGLVATVTGRKVQLIYDGCPGNINLTGLRLLP